MNAAALIAGLVACGVLGGAVGRFARNALGELRGGHGWGARWPEQGPTWTLIATFTVVYGGGILCWSFIFPMYDRYLWPLTVPLYALLLGHPVGASERRDPAPATAGRRPGVRTDGLGGLTAVLAAALAAASLALVVNADAFNAARWRMGDAAVARGMPAGTVDAGFEWVAFHATGVAVHDTPPPALGGGYDSWWPSLHLCALVSATPIKNDLLELVVADKKAYRLFLFRGPWEPLYLYRVLAPGCP